MELRPAGDWLHHFARLATALGRPYASVDCAAEDGPHGDIVADPQAVCAALGGG